MYCTYQAREGGRKRKRREGRERERELEVEARGWGSPVCFHEVSMLDSGKCVLPCNSSR